MSFWADKRVVVTGGAGFLLVNWGLHRVTHAHRVRFCFRTVKTLEFWQV